MPQHELSVLRTLPNAWFEAFGDIRAVADVVDGHSQEFVTRVSEEAAHGFRAIGVAPVEVGEHNIFGALQFGVRVAEHFDCELPSLLSKDFVRIPYGEFRKPGYLGATLRKG